ncbi:MAG TPA: hypothetical protein VGR53_08970 [Nitrososphaerales archaeon]|nr:hypothetical protein [Nitrososphaerales archaeon]
MGDSRAWKAMRWAWREYRTARLYGDEDTMTEEAFRIRLLQVGVGINLSAFQELGIMWPARLELETMS